MSSSHTLLSSWPRLPKRKRGWQALAALLALGGILLLGDGIYIKAKAGLAQVLLERAWQQSLQTQKPVKPWAWADTWPVAKIEVPRLNQSAIVLNGANGQAMAFGPSLMIGGPQLGEPGLSVISAHRDTHFRFLKNIEIGDLVSIEALDGRVHIFQVSETGIVDATHSGLSFDHDEALIALATCWPFDAIQQGSKRFVVIGALSKET